MSNPEAASASKYIVHTDQRQGKRYSHFIKHRTQNYYWL